jgi:signal transduction histidine kinase
VGIVRVDEAALMRFDRGELKQLPASVYGREDGLVTIGPSIEFQPNCWRAKDGSLWFAMANGVAGVRPDRVRINPLPPSVVGESVRVNDQPVWPARAGAVFAASGWTTYAVRDAVPTLRAGPGRVDLEFSYTGLSLGSPARVRFRYQLVGLETGWEDAGGARSVTYRSVPPGQYEFRVMACNSDGQWSEAATLARVEVRPHFYETLWFQVGGALLLAGGLALGVRRATRRRMQRRLDHLARQREMDRERTRIAQDLHDDLGAGLTEIGLLGSLAQRPAQAEERVREHLRHITDKSREMVTSLDEIVWSLNPKQDSLRALSQYFSEYAQQFLQVTALRCRIETAEELPELNLNPDQRQNLLLAYKEALTNIVRHAHATEVHITMLMEGDAFALSVTDDGCGVNAAAAGPGADGLANMARRLELLGGRCEVRSAPAAGTTVRLILPLDRIARRTRLPA